MEACLHFRGAALNASVAGIKRDRRDAFSFQMRVAKTIILPCGVGALPAGVFWLLGEEILHKERRDFVRRQNRGVRKICRRKKTKVSRPY